MTVDEFISGLTTQQNAALLLFRDSINAARDSASQSLVVEHARQIATVTTEKDSLALQVTNLTEQVTTLTSERDTLGKQIDEQAMRIESLVSEFAAKTLELGTAQATIANQEIDITNLSERLVTLLDQLQYNPRELSISAFRARLYTKLDVADVVAFYAADANPTLKQISATITKWNAKLPIRLDSPELIQPLAALIAFDLLTADEVAWLRRDATRQEAFFAD